MTTYQNVIVCPELIAARRTHSDSKIWSVITWTNGGCDGTIFLTRVYSRALMQFPRYPWVSRVSFNSNGFFQISAKDIDWTGIAARTWKNKSRYADYLRRVPKARGNIEQRCERTTICETSACDTQKEKNFFKSYECGGWRERNLSIVKYQSYFLKLIFRSSKNIFKNSSKVYSRLEHYIYISQGNYSILDESDIV